VQKKFIEQNDFYFFFDDVIRGDMIIRYAHPQGAVFTGH